MQTGGLEVGVWREEAGQQVAHWQTQAPPEEPTGKALLERLGTPENLVFPEDENLVRWGGVEGSGEAPLPGASLHPVT